MVYKKYTGKFAMPGSSQQYMSLDEFTLMLSVAGLINENFGQREASPLFNQSMMTNKVETEKETHLNMRFVEFLEALARVADKYELDKLENFFENYEAKSPY